MMTSKQSFFHNLASKTSTKNLTQANQQKPANRSSRSNYPKAIIRKKYKNIATVQLSEQLSVICALQLTPRIAIIIKVVATMIMLVLQTRIDNNKLFKFRMYRMHK